MRTRRMIPLRQAWWYQMKLNRFFRKAYKSFTYHLNKTYHEQREIRTAE